MFLDVERQQDKVLTVWLHPEEYAELRKGGRDHLLIIDREQLKAGVRGMIWGAYIRETFDHRVYLETEHGSHPRPSRWTLIGS